MLNMELFENGWEQGDVIFYKLKVDFKSATSMTAVSKVMFNEKNMVVHVEPGDPNGFTAGVFADLVSMGRK